MNWIRPWASLFGAVFAMGCGTVFSGDADGCPIGTEVASWTDRGYCELARGRYSEARAAFAAALARDPLAPEANFGAGWTELVALPGRVYTELWRRSFDQRASFAGFQGWVEDTFLASPDTPGSLAWIERHFATAAARPFRRPLTGTVVRFNYLELFLDYWEADRGDADFLAGVSALLQGLAEIFVAYDVDIPVAEVLRPGAPVYTIWALDLEAALANPEHPRFLRRRPGGLVALQRARDALVRWSRWWRRGIPEVMAEQDNQALPDLWACPRLGLHRRACPGPEPGSFPDYPDIVSQPFLTLDGTLFIPGFFGPAPTTAALTLLFMEDREGVVAAFNRLFPGTPADFPAAFMVVLERIEHSLRGFSPLDVAGVQVPLNLFFDVGPDLRDLVPTVLAFARTRSRGEALPYTLEALPNRVDPDALPWEQPERYEPVPDRSALERERLRGLDGPAAELHVGNGELMAGFTREGRLKNLFHPGSTSYNLVPYLTRVRHPILETEPIPYMGANPEHGSFVGLRFADGVVWPMDWLDYRHYDPMTDPTSRAVHPHYPEPGVPIVHVHYRDPVGRVELWEESFVPRYGEARDERPRILVRRFTVTNTTDAPLPVTVLYYGAFDLTDLDQYILGPRFWVTWRLRPNDLRITPEGGILWTGPGWRDHPDGPVAALLLAGEGGELVQAAVGELTEEGSLGAFAAAASPGVGMVALTETTFGNGLLAWDLGVLAPAETRQVTVYVALGAGDDAASAALAAQAQLATVRELGVEAVRDRTRAYWYAWARRGRRPTSALTTSTEREVYALARMALKLDQAALTGALPEMWDMQPMWFMVWPGNGAWHALALAAMGYLTEAEAYLDYLARIQAPDGHWRMAYTVLGEEHGAFEVEIYQTATILWFGWVYRRLSGDLGWLATYWPTLKRAADYLLMRRATNGLFYATADFVEDFTSIRQSLYTNTIGVAALLAASELSEELGERRDARRYRDAAERLYATVVATYWVPAKGRFYEQFDMHGAWGLGGVPTIAWPFHTFALTNPWVASLAERHLDPLVSHQDWLGFRNSHDWTPGLFKIAGFYVNHFHATGRERSRELAREIVAGVLRPYNRTLGGFIAERFFGYGVKGSGKPLLWPHSMFVLMKLAQADGVSPVPLITPLR